MTHFIFRPMMNIDIPGLGTATTLDCAALSVNSGPKKYIDGACVLADNDGDKIFSTYA